MLKRNLKQKKNLSLNKSIKKYSYIIYKKLKNILLF